MMRSGIDRGVLRRRQVEDALDPLVLDADLLRGRGSLFERPCDDQRNRLVIVLNLRTPEQSGCVPVGLPELAGRARGDDRENTRRGSRLGVIDGDDPALGNGRTDDASIRDVGREVAPLIGIRRGARRLQRTLDPIGGFADDLQLVDRIGGRGSVELHRVALRAWASTAPSVRSTSVSLNAFSRVGFAPASNVAVTALAPRGSSASAASTRHGLCATPPRATRPVPSRWTMAPTETSAKA